MKKVQFLKYVGLLCFCLYGSMVYSATTPTSMKVDKVHVNNWNIFFANVYAYHLYQLSQHDVDIKETTGGYHNKPNFYREIEYYKADTDQLLSRIQWEIEKPQQIHVIEVYVYDEAEKLKSDYLVAFLPEYRNAPIQTLINVHYSDDEFHSFRQFDASGYRIYESCKGKVFNEPVSISLTDDDFNSIETTIIQTMNSEEYLSCFEHLPVIVDAHLNPIKGIPLPEEIAIKAGIRQSMESTEIIDHDDIYQQINILSKKLQNSKDPELYIERGKAYFITHQFELATADYTAALTINDALDEAYFGRGMSLGREGKITQGIQDLTTYIQRNPSSSLAYTKRGVRNIWGRNFNAAENDLKQAIVLQPDNAEAHDDLGVLYARKGHYQDAIYHFKQVVNYDPDYLKGYHNLALTYHITGQNKQALKAINQALNLSKNEKDSLMLKGEILMKLGMEKEANNLIEQADFMPEGNWSERFSIQ